VLAAIITRLAGPDGKIPLTARYDEHEHVWQPPAPLLFQRRGGTELRPVSSGTIRNMLNAALARTGLADAAGQPLIFTPHDFRRMFITDAIMTGLPPHIAQVIAGHRNINATMGMACCGRRPAAARLRTLLAEAADQGMPAAGIIIGECDAPVAGSAFPAAARKSKHGTGTRHSTGTLLAADFARPSRRGADVLAACGNPADPAVRRPHARGRR
jgi:hypothetical protein